MKATPNPALSSFLIEPLCLSDCSIPGTHGQNSIEVQAGMVVSSNLVQEGVDEGHAAQLTCAQAELILMRRVLEGTALFGRDVGPRTRHVCVSCMVSGELMVSANVSNCLSLEDGDHGVY